MPGALISAVIAAALLLGGDYVLWRYTVQQLTLGYVTWITNARAAGWQVSAGEPVESGWPMRARLDVTGLFIVGGQAQLPGGLAWSADRLGIEIGLLHPHTLRLAPGGVQRLRLAALPDIAYSAGAMAIDVPLAGDKADTVLAVSHLHADLPAGALTIDAATLALDLPPPGDPTRLAARLRTGGIGLPAGVTWPFGPLIASLTLDAALTGAWPNVTPGPDGTVAPGPWLAAWRDNGGHLNVPSLLLQWGPLGMSANATLSLDARLRPAGNGSARVTGAPAALDAITASGLISAQQALAAKAVLGLMTKPASAAGPAELDLPLTAADGLLSIGQIPLLRLPALTGPG